MSYMYKVNHQIPSFGISYRKIQSELVIILKRRDTQTLDPFYKNTDTCLEVLQHTVANRIVISTYNQRVDGSSPPSVYALRQGILSTIVSLDPGVVNGYLAGIYSLKCFSASGSRG